MNTRKIKFKSVVWLVTVYVLYIVQGYETLFIFKNKHFIGKSKRSPKNGCFDFFESFFFSVKFSCFLGDIILTF